VRFHVWIWSVVTKFLKYLATNCVENDDEGKADFRTRFSFNGFILSIVDNTCVKPGDVAEQLANLDVVARGSLVEPVEEGMTT